VSISIDSDRDKSLSDDDATTHPDFDGQRINLHHPIRPTVERVGAELLPRRSQALAHLRNMLADKLAMPTVTLISARSPPAPTSHNQSGT
jgi:hypothetical protein